MTDDRNWRVLRTVEDVTPDIEQAVEDLVGTLDEDAPLRSQEFLDDLCKFYGGSGYDPTDFDLDAYDSAAAKRILALAREIRRGT